MRRIQPGLWIIVLAFCATDAQGQRRRQAPAPKPPTPVQASRTDTLIKGTTLEVYQVYQPELKPIVKREFSPSLPPVVKLPSPQQYEVPQQILNYSYRALPLRPLALGHDTASAPPQNYVLLGGGNLSTTLAEAGIASPHGRSWNADIWGRYLAQEGKLENQVYRSLQVRANGSYQASQHLFDASLSIYRNVLGRYGYDHDVQQFNFDQVRNVLGTGMLRIGMKNTADVLRGWNYHPEVRLGLFKSTISDEPTVDLDVPFSRTIDSALSVGIAFRGQFAWNNILDTSFSNNIIRLVPAADYRKGSFSAHLALAPAYGDGTGWMLLPDLKLRYQEPHNRFYAMAAWQADRLQNTIQQLSRSNPFLSLSPASIRQTTRHDVYGQVGVAIGSHLSIWARGGWQRHEGLPLFVAQAGGDGKDFNIIYDQSNQAIVWGGGLRFSVGEDFSAGAEGNWYNFYKTDYSRAFGEPAVRLKGDASWRVREGLLLTTYLEVLDKIWGRDAMGQVKEQAGVFDLGAAAEYTFVSRLSAFVRAENILGRKNERWLGYPTFGFNIYGGLRFRF